MGFSKMNISHIPFLFVLFVTTPVVLACDIEAITAEFADGEFENARAKALECMESGEHFEEAAFKLGIATRSHGNLAEAEDLLRKAVGADSWSVQYRLELAVTLEWQDKLEEALNIYRGILKENPDNLPARIGAARMTHWRGYVTSAISNYENILRDHPHDKAVNIGLGFAAISNMELSRSLSLFNGILEGDPNNADADNGLAMLDDIRRNRIRFSAGSNMDEQQSGVNLFSLSYARQESYRLRWGVNIVNRESLVTPPSNDVTINRAIGSGVSAFTDIKWNALQSTLLQYTSDEVNDDQRQQKFQFEYMHQLTNNHKWFLGAIPSWIEDNQVNFLSYAGYIFQPSKGFQLDVPTVFQ